MVAKLMSKNAENDDLVFTALNHRQKTMLSDVLCRLNGDGMKALNVDPKFQDFIEGKSGTYHIGIYTLSRCGKDDSDFLIGSDNHKDQDGIKRIQIGAVTVYITGDRKIRFTIPKHI